MPSCILVQLSGSNFDTIQGNALQTRTPANGKISGITIDVLSQLESEGGVVFRYFFPCRKEKYDAGGFPSLSRQAA